MCNYALKKEEKPPNIPPNMTFISENGHKEFLFIKDGVVSYLSLRYRLYILFIISNLYQSS